MIAAILSFGLVMFMISLGVAGRSATCEKSEIATYISVIAWGSMVFGLCVTKFLA